MTSEAYLVVFLVFLYIFHCLGNIY